MGFGGGVKPETKFNWDDANIAAKEWGANCGPGAIAAVLNKTLDEIRPRLGDFERKHYTNPMLMYQILRNLAPAWGTFKSGMWPYNGLVRVQWEGPWTEPGVPLRKRYRHTHWIASRWDDSEIYIFDINCICVGWIPVKEWTDQVVPWLVKGLEPLAYGTWHPTHKLWVAFP
jgi:hypothetical protein